MKRLLLLSVILISAFSLGQVPIVKWPKIFGGSASDDFKCIKECEDGTFFGLSFSSSTDGDVAGNMGLGNMWVMKISAEGNIIWQNFFGGSLLEYPRDILLTNDGGCVVAGYSKSNDGDLLSNNGNSDLWIFKLDSNGNMIWQQSYGGTGLDEVYSIDHTSDGGFIVGAMTLSNDIDVVGNHGGADAWVLKLDSFGNIEWSKCFGGSAWDRLYSIRESIDGNYIFAGYSPSTDGDLTGNIGLSDFWVVKIDQIGSIIWNKNFGGTAGDICKSMELTPDGGYILAGQSSSDDVDLTTNYGSSDACIIKIDSLGNLLWQKTIGGTQNEDINSISPTSDNGFVFFGSSSSNDIDLDENNGSDDFWIAKIDSVGNLVWSKTLGGSDYDYINDGIETSEGDYLMCGFTFSTDGDIPISYGFDDSYLVKLSEAYLTGNVFHDFSADCIIDSLDAPIEGVNLIIDPGNIVVSTNYEGIWSKDSLPAGNYFITIDTTNLNWIVTCPATQNFSILNSQDLTEGPDFGLLSTDSCSLPNVSIFAPVLRSCFSNQIVYVEACNEIMAAEILYSAYCEVELDSYLTVTSASVPYTSLGNNLYSFDLGDLYPGQCINFTINTTVSCDAILGETLCMEATLYPIESCMLDTIPNNPVLPTSGNDPDLVLPQPCILPWDNSSLLVEGGCLGDSVQFSITNTGDFLGGDMDCYSPVFIYVNDTLFSIDSVQLQGQETVYYTFPSYGETWILHADQHPLHPGNSEPTAYIELCGSDSSQWIPGLINNQPLDDADPFLDIYCGVVSGSYDPNDKRGFPIGMSDDHLLLPNQQLQYVIRFQNTGTDTAITVVIRDTLDTDLNIFTVTPGASSHNYSFQIYGPRILEWKFDNILLPDSTTNEPESNGFVTFTVDQVPNLPNGTLITNRADIYFDFNAPIVTNETTHLIDDRLQSNPLVIKEITTEDGTLIKVYPNPNNGMIFIELENQPISMEYVIYEISGKVVLSGKLTELKNPIDIQKLNAGIYLIQIGEAEIVKIVKE